MDSDVRKLLNTIWKWYRYKDFICMVTQQFYDKAAFYAPKEFDTNCPINFTDGCLYIFDVELIVSEQLIHNYHLISVDDYKTWLQMAQYRTGAYSGREIDFLIKYKVGLE